MFGSAPAASSALTMRCCPDARRTAEASSRRRRAVRIGAAVQQRGPRGRRPAARLRATLRPVPLSRRRPAATRSKQSLTIVGSSSLRSSGSIFDGGRRGGAGPPVDERTVSQMCPTSPPRARHRPLAAAATSTRSHTVPRRRRFRHQQRVVAAATPRSPSGRAEPQPAARARSRRNADAGPPRRP